MTRIVTSGSLILERLNQRHRLEVHLWIGPVGLINLGQDFLRQLAFLPVALRPVDIWNRF